MIISISGKFRSGKDTAAMLIGEKLILAGYKTKRIAFADTVKDIVELLTGVNRIEYTSKGYSYPFLDYTDEQKNSFLDTWKMSIGTMLQTIGTDVMRNNFNKEVWINSVFEKIQKRAENEIILITDTRFKNEIEALKRKGAICIKIEGDPIKAAEKSSRNKNHQSETDLDNYKDYEYIIKNDGTLEDLENKINFIVDKILTYDRFLISNV